jgi:uncharacterized protein (TIGR02001 family)
MRYLHKALIIAGLATLPLAPGIAQAQTPVAPAAAPAPEPTPEHVFTGNVGLFSEYLFRGIAQTAGKPAVQGGFDYAHSSGFYVGTWASNVSWLEDFGLYTRSSMEWDFYGGYKNSFADDWTYDVGLYYYYYPGKANPGVPSANTFEGYGAIGWKWLSAKASYSFQNYFGAEPNGKKTDGTWYFDFSAAYPVGESGFTLLAHYGILDVKNDPSGSASISYDDWRIGASYIIQGGMMKGAEIGAYYSGTNAEKAYYTDLTGYDTGKDRGVIYFKKTF